MTIACRSVECKKHGTEHSITIINGKCNDYEPKPKEIEKIIISETGLMATSFDKSIKGYSLPNDQALAMKINELIDAVNELRRRE